MGFALSRVRGLACAAMPGGADTSGGLPFLGPGHRSVEQVGAARAFVRSLFACGPGAGLGFFELDLERGLVHLDLGAARMTSGDDGLEDGLTVSREAFLSAFSGEVRDALAGLGTRQAGFTVEGRVGRTEEPRFVAVTVPPGAEGPIFGVLRDTTRHRREIELAQSAQRLESIGRLAGGVAHDFNNLLTTILGSAELLQEETDTEEIRALAEEIVMAGERGRELTQRLLTLSRRRQVERKKTELVSWIRSSVDAWRRLLEPGVRLDVDLPNDRMVSWVDPRGLEQVMHNLLVNARDATPDGGRIEIALELSGPPPEGSGSNWCTLRVSDDGTGMEPGVQARVLEPFFTTKDVGQGTGLGLSTSHAIVRQFGGELALDSRPGRGTHVRMWLPLTEQDPTDDMPERISVPPEVRRQRILVLEDDRSVGLTMERMLARLGFEVALVHDEASAFAVMRSERIDLLVSDVVMPRTTGPAVARRLRQEFPQLRVLFVSGFAGTELERHGWDPQTPLLAKPFTADALLGRILELLVS